MSIPEQMRGVILTGHGGPEMLEWREDLPVPSPAEGEVLIRVSAAGVNNTDINTRLAWYSKDDGAAEDAAWSGQPLTFPRIQGADACGRIVAVGKGVDAGRIGERVIIEPCLQEANGAQLETPWYFGSECDGGFSDYTRVAARHAHAIQCDLTDTELASFPCSYSTAENLLTRAKVDASDTVFVTGASGGVGSAVVQLARARGAKVIAVTSPEKSDTMRELGATEILHRTSNYPIVLGKNSVDVVVDLVGGPAWPSLLDLLKPGGRYAIAGAIAGASVELDLRTLYLKDLTLLGCTVLSPGVFRNLVSRIENADIVPLVAQTFSLRDIAEAQSAFAEKSHVGKIVLELD